MYTKVYMRVMNAASLTRVRHESIYACDECCILDKGQVYENIYQFDVTSILDKVKYQVET